MNLLAGLSSPLSAIGFLGTFSYAARELIAALAIFGVGFAVLFLATVAILLYHHLNDRGSAWLQRQAPRWNRASRNCLVALFRNEQTPVFIAATVQLPALKQLNHTVVFAQIQE